MHDINFLHQHELEDGDFTNCCKDCRISVKIIKPHIIRFAEKTKSCTLQMLSDLKQDELDDLAHLDTGAHLARLVLRDPAIRAELPIIRSILKTAGGR